MSNACMVQKKPVKNTENLFVAALELVDKCTNYPTTKLNRYKQTVNHPGHMLANIMLHAPGAYIAGGFAREMYRFFIAARDGESKSSKISDAAKSWIENELLLQNANFSYATGDIDIFCKTTQDVHELNAQLRQHTVDSKPFVTANATSYVLDGVKIQVIHKLIGTPEDVIGSFDIANAMVAIEQDGTLTTTNEFHTAENEMAIHVVNWVDPPVTFSRVVKWMWHHRYNAMSPETAHMFVKTHVNLVENINLALAKGATHYTLSNGHKVDMKKAKSFMNRAFFYNDNMMNVISDEDLLLLSAFYPNTVSYNNMRCNLSFDTLTKRYVNNFGEKAIR